MKKTVLKYGLISGGILAVTMAVSAPLGANGTIGFDMAEVIGYSSMILAFLVIFFGIRSYREEVGGGTLGFWRGVKVGLLITLISCGMYVATWEIYYFNFDSGFIEKYSQHALEKMAAKGATAEKLAEEKKKMAAFRDMYQNPLINSAITFMEAFPIGLLMTFVSAAILWKKPHPDGGSPAASAIAA